MTTTLTLSPPRLRPVGTIKAPDRFNGGWYIGILAMDTEELFWLDGTNGAGQDSLFPVDDCYAAIHCTSIGTAPELRRAA